MATPITLTHAQYLDAFSKTDSDKTNFERHLEVCGIKSKMDMVRRTKKFLWGTKDGLNNITWSPLSKFSKSHLSSIKTFLLNYPHGLDDEDIGTVIDLVNVAIANA